MVGPRQRGAVGVARAEQDKADAGSRIDTPAAGGRIPVLTSIRGLAAWWVVLFHFRAYLPVGLPQPLRRAVEHGYLAVDLFFILSGFVIGLSYLDRFDAGSGADYRRFLILRIARIYPLHLVLMLAYLTVPVAIILFARTHDPGARFGPGGFVLSLLLVQDWGWTDDLVWNIPSWSISTEWAAYLLFPVLAVLARMAVRGTVSGLVVVVGLLAALALASNRTGGLGADIPGFGLERCLIEFAVGLVLYRLFGRLRRARSSSALAAGGVALALCAAQWLAGPPDGWLMPGTFAALVFHLAASGRGPARWLALPALEKLGEISYATYLVHYLVKDWVTLVLVRPGVPGWVALAAYLGVTAAASVLLYHAVERPGRRLLRALAPAAAPEPSASGKVACR